MKAYNQKSNNLLKKNLILINLNNPKFNKNNNSNNYDKKVIKKVVQILMKKILKKMVTVQIDQKFKKNK